MGKLCVVHCRYRPDTYYTWLGKLRRREAQLMPVQPINVAKNDDQKRKGLFLYLITSYILRKGAKRHISYVGKSRNIIRRIKQHNGQLPRGPKPTRNASQPWKLSLALGPFQKHATELRRLWRKKSRGIDSRIKYGTMTAANTGKPLYTDLPNLTALLEKTPLKI